MKAGEEAQLVTDLLLRVQAALFRHVSNAAAQVIVDRSIAHEHLAAVRREHSQCDPHGGGLAGTVGADETVHLTRLYLERHVVEDLVVPVTLIEVVDIESFHIFLVSLYNVNP